VDARHKAGHDEFVGATDYTSQTEHAARLAICDRPAGGGGQQRVICDRASGPASNIRKRALRERDANLRSGHLCRLLIGTWHAGHSFPYGQLWTAWLAAAPKSRPSSREAALASLRARPRPVRAPADPTDASEELKASGR
jgi:hypothetical protein